MAANNLLNTRARLRRHLNNTRNLLLGELAVVLVDVDSPHGLHRRILADDHLSHVLHTVKARVVDPDDRDDARNFLKKVLVRSVEFLGR